MALGAAALGLTLTWLHRRQASRHRSGGSNGNGSNHCRGVKLVPRGRPLVAQPDEVSLVSYNILCERCGGLGGAAVGARVGVPAPPDSVPVNPLPCLASCGFLSSPDCTAHCPLQLLLPLLCRYANARRLPHVFAQYLDPDYRWERLQAREEGFAA